MEKDIKKIIESWSGIEEAIHVLTKREEKLSIAMSDTGILSGHQFDALVAIAFFDIHNVTTIAQTIGCSKSAASIMLSKMMTKNLIKKTYGHDSSDNRSIYIEITPDGTAVVRDFMRTRIAIVGSIYDRMSEELRTETYLGMESFCRIYDIGDSFLYSISEELVNEAELSDEKKKFILKLFEFAGSRIISDQKIAGNSSLLCKNLTIQQVGMLKAIYINNQNTVSKLVKTFGTSVSTVSVNVSRLVKAGYIVKEYGKTGDNRETVLSVTDKAREEIAELERKYYKMFMEYYHKLDNEKKELLEQGIKHFDKAVKIIKAEVEK